MLGLPDLFNCLMNVSLCAGHGHKYGHDKVGIRAWLVGYIATLYWICYRILFVNCVPGHNFKQEAMTVCYYTEVINLGHCNRVLFLNSTFASGWDAASK